METFLIQDRFKPVFFNCVYISRSVSDRPIYQRLDKTCQIHANEVERTTLRPCARENTYQLQYTIKPMGFHPFSGIH